MILRFIQILVLLSMAGSAYTQETGYFYVKLRNDDGIEKTTRELEARFTGAQVSRPFASVTFDNLHRVIRVDGPGISAEGLAGAVTVPVEYIEKVPVSRPLYTPDDLGVELGSPNQWYLHTIGAPAAWDYFKGSPDVMVAVVDNAFLVDHPDLRNKIRINTGEIPNNGIDDDNNGFIDDYKGWNSRSNNGSVSNQSENSTHGTHVAGLAAAQTDNGIGIASLSFLTQWLPIKASDANDNITHGYEGISFAASREAKVINCSWGSFDSSATAKSVIGFALSKNCFVVASAGNFADETPVYPATYRGVISVAATTQSDLKLNTSSFNHRVNISAPGSGIWSTISSQTGQPSYGFLSGTSQASPLTAALLALMSGYAPPGNDDVILDCLYGTAVPLNDIPGNQAYRNMLGRGRINAESAMRCLFETLHLGIKETAADGMKLYPNPSTGQFSVQTDTQPETGLYWILKDINGKELCKGTQATGDVSQLSPGMYFITVIQPKTGRQSTVKLVKE